MRPYYTIFAIFCLLSMVQARFPDDLVIQVELDGERLCVNINQQRLPNMHTYTGFDAFITGYMDGFYDCEHRRTNTDGSGIGDYGMTLYGASGQLGLYCRRVFLATMTLLAPYFSM